MGFISWYDFNEQDASVTMPELFKIGSFVDERIISNFRDVIPPIYEGQNIFQLGEPYCHAEDENNKFRPCFLTFSLEDKGWMFRGACFYQSVINRSDNFEHAVPTVKEYCIDEYAKSFVHAAQKMQDDYANGVDISKLSIIYDYMKLNPYNLAGLYLFTHDDAALQAFKSNWENHMDDKLYRPVVELLQQKDMLLSNNIEKELKVKESFGSDINSLLADATRRAAFDDKSGKALERDDRGLDIN